MGGFLAGGVGAEADDGAISGEESSRGEGGGIEGSDNVGRRFGVRSVDVKTGDVWGEGGGDLGGVGGEKGKIVSLSGDVGGGAVESLM